MNIKHDILRVFYNYIFSWAYYDLDFFINKRENLRGNIIAILPNFLDSECEVLRFALVRRNNQPFWSVLLNFKTSIWWFLEHRTHSFVLIASTLWIIVWRRTYFGNFKGARVLNCTQTCWKDCMIRWRWMSNNFDSFSYYFINITSCQYSNEVFYWLHWWS